MKRALALALLAGCMKGDGAVPRGGAGAVKGGPSAETPIAVATGAEARAAAGKVVRVTGTLQREKRGDAIDSPGLNVLCPDTRLPDDAIGRSVTVEGRLERAEEPAAAVGPNGEISQGMETASSYWVIRGCVRR